MKFTSIFLSTLFIDTIQVLYINWTDGNLATINWVRPLSEEINSIIISHTIGDMPQEMTTFANNVTHWSFNVPLNTQYAISIAAGVAINDSTLIMGPYTTLNGMYDIAILT